MSAIPWVFFCISAIGVGMMIIAVPTAIYFHMNAVWCLYYIYSTVINIMGDLPWSSCDNDFNTPCTSRSNIWSYLNNFNILPFQAF